jgi:bacterioferritin-associated ferredoxin
VVNDRAMIVCSCNASSDQDVRSASTAERTRSTSRVYGCLGRSARCGEAVVVLIARRLAQERTKPGKARQDGNRPHAYTSVIREPESAP